jgi:hypothetical protein
MKRLTLVGSTACERWGASLGAPLHMLLQKRLAVWCDTFMALRSLHQFRVTHRPKGGTADEASIGAQGP